MKTIYREYAAELTKQDLINCGISEVTKEGVVYGATGKKLKPLRVPSGKNRFYLCLTRYNKVTKKTQTLAIHRIVYIWFNGIQHAGMVIDHINNNQLDNRLENLQEVTPEENLAKDRSYCRKEKVKFFDKERLENKLKHYVDLYEEAKKAHDAVAAHKYRSSISKYKAQLRDWEANREEYETIDREKKAFLAFKQEHSKKVRERSLIIKTLKENIKKEKLAGNKEK